MPATPRGCKKGAGDLGDCGGAALPHLHVGFSAQEVCNRFDGGVAFGGESVDWRRGAKTH